MPLAERVFNVLLALSALSWAVLGLMFAEPETRFTPPRLAITGFNACVAFLVLARSSVRRHGSPASWLAAVPSLVAGGVALKVAPSPEFWLLHAEIVFVAGLMWASLSFLFLGRSFALLPAVRSLVRRGPFRIIRHPAYLGEFLAVLGCGLASANWVHAWPAAAVVPLIVLRIVAEERVLGSIPEYDEYRRNIRWRLIPGVW